MWSRIFVVLLSLCAFSDIISALPPFRPELNGDSEIHGIKEGIVNPLYRLPTNVVPSHYILEIRPILDPGFGVRFTAPGKVRILAECNAPSSSIVLHSLGTTIGLVKVTSKPEEADVPVVGDLEFNIQDQTVTIRLGAPGLEAGKNYEIYIEFVSLVAQNRTDGLYLSSYIDPITKEIKYMCATDLEADDARRIFPLFDEPALKTKWTVSILRTANYHSLANHEKDGPPVPVVGEDGWWRDNYKEVIPMSSYLLAFAVSDFTSEAAHPSLFGGKPVTMWGPPSIMAEGGGIYSANASAKFLEFFEATFESTYPLPKMDKISLPDFSSGAMENWGLNTYREGRLLYLEGISTVADKVGMTTTISHELAHQWFGNLVTMRWWNDLWLNEGFATYMAALGVEAVFPTYSPIESLLVNSIQPAMQMDASTSTHPISPDEGTVQNETDFSNLFSTIVYHKGASIIRMTNAFLAGKMMPALKKYLTEFEYSNAVQDDLFRVLQTEADTTSLPPGGITVKQILDTWTKQTGYPVVTVERPASGDRIIFKQAKFGTTPGPPWWIPITFVRSGYVDADTTTKVWLGTTEIEHSVTIPVAEWVLVNPTQIGNYRVLYEQSNYDLLREQLNADDTKIDTMSKSALLDDYFNFAFRGIGGIQLTQALDLTKFLAKERHFVPWTTFFTNMAQSYRLLGRSSAFLDYRRYLLSLTDLPLKELGFDAKEDDTPGGQILLRTRLVEWACNLGESSCVDFAKSKFAEWITTPNPAANNKINPDLRTTVYCAVVANGGDEVWDFVIARYKDATEATSSKYLPDVARISLIRALGCAKQSYRLAKLLDLAIDLESFILPEHRVTAIQAVAGNSAGVDLAFNFLRNNFDTIARRLGGVGPFASSVSTLSNYLTTATEKADLQAFVNSKEEELRPVKSSLDASIENVQKNVDWITTHLPSLRTWLRTN